MTKFFALALAFAVGMAKAQTPATNPMPDGSLDMYVGLGVVAQPRYEGAWAEKHRLLPVLQVQWSNGLFIAGSSAGMHLSPDPRIEFGPLVELQARRDESGNGSEGAGAGDGPFRLMSLPAAPSSNRLAGMAPIGTRLLGGVFLNAYMTPAWRLTSNLLYGAGKARHGARLELGVQRVATSVGRQHRFAWGAGMTLANRSYNTAFFGVTEDESYASGNAMYEAAGGIKDAHLGLHWNWAWSPSWMLTSQVQAIHLLGSARHSPLVERSTNLTASTAIGYRF